MKLRLAGLLLLLGAITVYAQQTSEPYRIAVLMDGPSQHLDAFHLPILIREVRTLTEKEFNTSFPEELRLSADWTMPGVKALMDRLLADESVDMVICMGLLATIDACSRGDLPKPVFAPFGIDADLPLYPKQGVGSGVRNLNYLNTPGSFERDIRTFKRLIQFETVHLIGDFHFLQAVPQLIPYVNEITERLGVSYKLIPVDASLEEAVGRIPEDVEAVYIAPLLRFDDGAKQKLFEVLKQKRIPSFSLLGREEVEQGVLSGLAPAEDTVRWSRRIALNVQRSLLGEDPGTFPVIFSIGGKLSINMDTARAIGWYPTWDIFVSADLINREPKQAGRRMTLAEAVHEAMEKNVELAAQKLELELGRQAIREVEANRKPHLDASATGVKVDSDTADNSFGSQPEESVFGTVSLTQLLYSDQANAAVQIQELLQISREKEYEARRLDLAGETATRFLEYLKAETFKRIRQNNLDLTNSNLETARVRRKIGIGNPGEVYRWESQIATDRSEAITARARADAALSALNQMLNARQEELLEAVTPSLLDPNLKTGKGRLAPYVDDPWSFEVFRAFMVDEGLRDAPELAQLRALIAAKEREDKNNRRSFYSPVVSVQSQLKHFFHRSDFELESRPFPLPQFKDTSWNVALNVSLPILTGGTRKARLARSITELSQLRLAEENLRQQIELRIRVALRQVGASAAAIDLAGEAAEAARKNLNLAADSFAKGLATSLDLLDAQNAALIAEERAAGAVFDFFVDLMELERAVGNFDFFISPQEQDAYYQRLEKFYQDYDLGK